MTSLRDAAQQALEALTAHADLHSTMYLKMDAITALRAALAEPVQAKPDHETRAEIAEQQVVQLAEERDHYRNLWLKAKQAEPVQEPDSPERRCGGPGCDMTCCQPVQEPVAWSHINGTSDTKWQPQRPAEPVQQPEKSDFRTPAERNVMSEVVTDPAVVARLPRATWQVEWQWRSWRITGGPIGTMRYANAKGYFLGPLFVCRPMPWLLGPARSLHPEVFEAALAEPVQEPDPTYKRIGCVQHDCEECQRRTQRKPLTEEEIQAAWDSVDMRHPRGNETRIAFARAIERAHGIGGEG